MKVFRLPDPLSAVSSSDAFGRFAERRPFFFSAIGAVVLCFAALMPPVSFSVGTESTDLLTGNDLNRQEVKKAVADCIDDNKDNASPTNALTVYKLRPSCVRPRPGDPDSERSNDKRP